MSTPSTLLAIVGIDLGDYATRDLTCAIEPITLGELARDVNGNLVDMTLESFRKYAVTISCSDMEAPELVNVWRGKEVTVTLVPETGLDEDSDGPLTLSCMVDSWQTSRREWRAETGWSLTLIQQ